MDAQEPQTDLAELVAQGRALLRASKTAPAREVFLEAFRRAEQRYPADASKSLPYLLWALRSFALWREDKRQEWPEAVSLCDQALALSTSSPGPNQAYLLDLLELRASFWHALGQMTNAREDARRAAQGWMQSVPSLRGVGYTVLGVCDLLIRLGEPAEALSVARRARAALDVPESDPRLQRIADYLIGQSLVAMKNHDDARKHIEAVLEAHSKAFPQAESPFRQRMQSLLDEIDDAIRPASTDNVRAQAVSATATSPSAAEGGKQGR